MKSVGEDASLEIFETLCDSLQDSVLLFESDGTLVHVNQRFCEATATPRDRFVGAPLTDLGDFVTEEDLASFRDGVEAVLAGRSSERRLELEATSPAEGDIVVEARITPFETDELTGAAVVLRDFTEKVETTEALDLKSEQLAVINAVLRHDVRNDMNIMMGWVEHLDDHHSADERAAVRDRLLRHGSHVVEITYAARELMEAIETEWELEVRPTPLRDTIVREVELVSEQFPDAEVALPEALPEVTVQADEFLGSVVENLLTNAIRHNDAETPRVRVTVQSERERVSVSVADNGPGIPDEQKEAVYGMGETASDSSGTGLGLYLVESLVHAYGGTVTIADRDPRGTVVTFTLERAD